MSRALSSRLSHAHHAAVTLAFLLGGCSGACPRADDAATGSTYEIRWTQSWTGHRGAGELGFTATEHQVVCEFRHERAGGPSPESFLGPAVRFADNSASLISPNADSTGCPAGEALAEVFADHHAMGEALSQAEGFPFPYYVTIHGFVWPDELRRGATAQLARDRIVAARASVDCMVKRMRRFHRTLRVSVDELAHSRIPSTPEWARVEDGAGRIGVRLQTINYDPPFPFRGRVLAPAPEVRVLDEMVRYARGLPEHEATEGRHVRSRLSVRFKGVPVAPAKASAGRRPAHESLDVRLGALYEQLCRVPLARAAHDPAPHRPAGAGDASR